MRGRKAPVIELSVRQHAALTRLVRQPTTEHRVGARARIILAAAQGGQNQEIAQRLGIDPDTVCKSGTLGPSPRAAGGRRSR